MTKVTLEAFRDVKATLLETFYDICEEGTCYPLSEIDTTTLYYAMQQSKLMISFSNLIEAKIGQFKVSDIDKVPIDLFFVDISIYLGISYEEAKRRFLDSPGIEGYPFNNIEEDTDDMHGPPYLEISLKKGRPHLNSLLAQPLQYENFLDSTFNFCSTNLGFTPACHVFTDVNLAQTDVTSGLQSFLKYLVKQDIPFAAVCDNWELEMENIIIAGVGTQNRRYLPNPNSSTEKTERVFRNVVSHIIPRFE